MILKTEDLQKQGLNQEQINYVMAVVGKEVNALASERDNYKTQLVTAQQTLKSFEGVNVQELRGEIAKLTADMATKDAEHQKQIADRDFNDLLKETASAFKPRALKADIKDALEALKKDNAYLFQDVSIPRVVSHTSGPGGERTEDTKSRANEALRSFFGRE